MKKTEEIEMIGGFRTITAAEEKALSEYLRQKKVTAPAKQLKKSKNSWNEHFGN
jgi:hypothetical protein